MGLFSRRRPNVRRLARRGDLGGLIHALEHVEVVRDREGSYLDVGGLVRRDAVVALADRDEPSVRQALIERLSDEDESVRLETIRALRKWPDEPVARAFAGGVGSWPSPEGDGSRDEALAALLDIGHPRTLELLVVAMVRGERGSPLHETDASSLRAVRAHHGEDARDVTWSLVAALNDERVEVRDRAETVLIWLEPDSVEPLVAALDRPEVRCRAARALGDLRDSRAVGPLVDTIFDQDPTVRRTVARALGQIKDPSAAGVLLRSSRDPDYGVRSAAIGALEELGAAAVMVAIAEFGAAIAGTIERESDARPAIRRSGTA
jgi:HEAT repeat protein